MSAIGILGGMGPQASNRLYSLLIDGTKRYIPNAIDSDYPEVVLLNVPVPNFISNKNQLPKAREMLQKRTTLLENANCSVAGIACNTAHILLPDLQAASTIPFLSIPKLVQEKITALNYRRVGLLGTPTTLASSLYDDVLANGVTLVRPNTRLAKQVERYIYKQLNDALSEKDRADFRLLVHRFKHAQNLDTVILGCTELPVIYDISDDPHIVDTLQVLAEGLLHAYFKPSQSSP